MRNKFIFRLSLDKLTSIDAFSEASREELRVLLALAGAEGKVECEDTLASLAKTSRARTVAALALWEELGVITRGERIVKEEFENNFNESDIDETASVDTAKSIRDENLGSMLSECTALMGKAALSTQEIKNICVLNTEYALSPEYITTLAAHIASKGKLTATRLREDGKRLSSKGINTLEELEQYILEREQESGDEWELRSALGIYNRNLSQSEREYFKRWSGEFSYSINIISLAFDICVLNTGKLSMAYMDKLLTAWHAAGCKTLEECRSANASHTAQGHESSTSAKKHKRTEPEKPRYGDFDVNEAFRHALSRSFGEDED